MQQGGLKIPRTPDSVRQGGGRPQPTSADLQDPQIVSDGTDKTLIQEKKKILQDLGMCAPLHLRMRPKCAEGDRAELH